MAQSITEKLDAIRDQVAGFAGNFTDKLSEMNALKSKVDAAADKANAAAVLSSNTTHAVYIYLDTENGDDANEPGGYGDFDTAVKTWERALDACHAGRRCVIYVRGTLVADKRYTLDAPPSIIEYRAWDAGVENAPRPKLQFADDITDPDNIVPGGIYSFSSFDVYINGIDIEMAHSSSSSPIYMNCGFLVASAFYTKITRTGSGGALFRPNYSGAFRMGGSVEIDASAAGYVIHGVAAGADPNAKVGITASFESA